MDRHPKAKELVDTARVASNKALKSWWARMSESERAEFCKKRAAIQAEKKASK